MSKIPCFEYDDMSNTTEKVIGSFGGMVLYGKYIDEVLTNPIVADQRASFSKNVGNVKIINVMGTVTPLTVGTPWYNSDIGLISTGIYSDMKSMTYGCHMQDGSIWIFLATNYTEIRLRAYIIYTKD